MAAYLVRRLASGVLLVFALTTITYAVFRLIPTDPACMVVSCRPGNHTTPAQLAEARETLGLDRPFVVQYGEFLRDIVRHGELRTFRVFSTPLEDTFTQYAPVTLSLVLGGAVLLVLLALPLGALSALRPHRLLDRGVLAFSLVGIALHPFVVGLLLRALLADRLHVAPHSGYCGIRASPGSACGGLADWAYHLYLPWLCFALFFLPVYTRMFRARVLQTLGEPFVRTARAKGASEGRVLRGHVLRNAALPILPMLAMDVGTAVTIAIYVETVFGVNGLGKLVVDSLSGEGGFYSLDGIMRVVFVVAVAVVVLNLLADIALVALDPRITGRSGSRPVWRTADGGLHRRRIAIALAVVAAAVGGSVAAARTGGGTASGLALYEKGAGPAMATLTEHIATSVYTLDVRVDRVMSGPNGWTMRARIVNRSADALTIPGLVRQRDLSYGGFRLVSLSGARFAPDVLVWATDYEPPLPVSLIPGTAASIEFGGPDRLPRGVALTVDLGMLAPASGARSISVRTTKALMLR